MEIIHRLQKNLEVLIQSMTRVSSRSEMLGAIHQVCLLRPFRVLKWPSKAKVNKEACLFTSQFPCMCRRPEWVKRWRWWFSMWRTWGGCTQRSTQSCWSSERTSRRMRGPLGPTLKGVSWYYSLKKSDKNQSHFCQSHGFSFVIGRWF